MNAPCQSPESRRVFDDEALQLIARGICGRCPVLNPCRESVLNQEASGHPVHGVAGGLLPSERPHAVRMEPARLGRPPVHIQARRDVIIRPACGTTTGARRHERAKEDLCQPCLDARRTRLRESARRGRLSA